MHFLLNDKDIIRQGILHLLQIKDTDIRTMNLAQCKSAVDGAIHIGGASSATIPMVSLFYGGFIQLDIEQPTRTDQDVFVLSKGHAVATLASIYSDLGYFSTDLLEHSRSIDSLLNGHPGPLLPGVHIATGPMGQGIGVAQGMAIAGQRAPKFDVFAVTGDGELQEGPVWEAIMFAGFKKLENFCVMVDYNGGQLDDVSRLHFPYHSLAGNFESFGWNVIEIDSSKYHTVFDALATFKYGKRNGKPTAIICKSTKGEGGLSRFMNTHKSKMDLNVLEQEMASQALIRKNRVKDFTAFLNSLKDLENRSQIKDTLHSFALSMGLEISEDSEIKVEARKPVVRTKKAPVRNKTIDYDPQALPRLEMGSSYLAHKVIENAMHTFAKDPRIVSIDSDLASTSGLQDGVGAVDKYRALNVGVAEANMVLIGEGFSILGNNVWVSTFCPFFDWKLIRRIAVGHQERLEVIADDGWLSQGHGLDLTFLATAADFDTQANGATHMGNDDIMMMNAAAHIKVINASCPRQVLSIMQWIMAGNKGLVYLRILRAESEVIYDSNYVFEYGKAYRIKSSESSRATLISSGRGVHEALQAADLLTQDGIAVDVIDMPSIDSEMIIELADKNKPIVVAEQNNGYLMENIRKVLFENVGSIDASKITGINTTSKGGLHYIHSGTYDELTAHYGLDSSSLAKRIKSILS